MVTSRRRRRKNNRCRCNRTELVEFQVSIFIYSYLCDQRDHQRDLTRLSRNPPERKVTPVRPLLPFNPSLIDIFCRKRGERPFIISACLLTIVSGAITSQVSQKRVRKFFLQLLQICDANCFILWQFEPSPAMLDCSTRNSLVEIRLSVAFIYFFYWINIYFVLNSCFIACVLRAECPSWTLT